MQTSSENGIEPRNFYRIRKTLVEKLSMIKGEDSWYTVYGESMQEVLCCHVLGNCTRGLSAHREKDGSEVLFRMQPKGKLMNMTYFVNAGSAGSLLATIKLFVGRGMKILDPQGQEVYRIIDARGALDKVVVDVLEGACTEYALVRDGERLGLFKPRKRPASGSASGHGLIRRTILKVLGSSSDWSMELGDRAGKIEDHRPLLAALILLKEHTIRNDQSS
jgi:hypothetical protein